MDECKSGHWLIPKNSNIGTCIFWDSTKQSCSKGVLCPWDGVKRFSSSTSTYDNPLISTPEEIKKKNIGRRAFIRQTWGFSRKG